MDSKSQLQYLEYRRKRVKRIKAFMLFICALFVLSPTVLCTVLFFKVIKLEKAFENLEGQFIMAQEESVKSETFVADSIIIPNTTDTIIKDNTPDAEKYEGQTRVYLTFDDGPTDYTDEVLDILSEYDIKATFFTIAHEGKEVEYNRIVDEGHTLAIHSYTHDYGKIYSSIDSFTEDITTMSNYLYEITGVRPKFYRFPGGSSNGVSGISKDDMFDVLDKEGLVYFDWNASAQDAVAGGLSTNQVVNNVLGGINENGETVVLMHDSAGKSTTVEALPIIIERLKEKGNVVFLPITEYTEPVQHVKKGE